MKHRILIFGAGVIGSGYAVKFSEAGYDVSVLARGGRLQTLESKGLLYSKQGMVKKARVSVLQKLSGSDTFDYIFVTVRYEQIKAALSELHDNNSPNIVTMVNNPHGYNIWENLLGKGRLIPAFAGAGGRIDDGVLYFRLTPRIIQPTTFGELNGVKTSRLRALAKIMRTSRIPYSISKNMDAWQKSHLAMVTALANGIYYDGGDNYTTARNQDAIRFMSASLRKNFLALKARKIPITPSKLNIFHICPIWIMNIALKFLYNTKFAATLISSHALNAKDEMLLLDRDFKNLICER
ncbi:MAG: ketopantoate reductase family protein [Defluviitaleaceae bacterium]|nr:ketopantoate reductase family protein [Defluviitaleaceae bacterium]